MFDLAVWGGRRMDALGEFWDLSRVLVKSGSAFLDSSCAPCHTPPHPPNMLLVTQLPAGDDDSLGTLAWCVAPPRAPHPPTAPELLPSAPLQCDSNPLEAVANSAESSNL